MIAERLKQAIASFIAEEAETVPVIDGVAVSISGEADDATFPLIVIQDTGSDVYEQDGVIMRGVDTVTLNVELHSVPTASAEAGTDFDDHDELGEAVYNALGSAAGFSFISAFEGVGLFDFRVSAGTMETDPPRRKTVYEIVAIACPT